MDPLTVGSVACGVISGLIILLVERKIFPEKEAPPKVIYYDQRGTPVQRKMSAPVNALPGWTLIVLSVCLPPLAVYLKKGNHTMLWLNVGLTFLWFVPGICHALMIVLGSYFDQP